MDNDSKKKRATEQYNLMTTILRHPRYTHHCIVFAYQRSIRSLKIVIKCMLPRTKHRVKKKAV